MGAFVRLVNDICLLRFESVLCVVNSAGPSSLAARCHDDDKERERDLLLLYEQPELRRDKWLAAWRYAAKVPWVARQSCAGVHLLSAPPPRWQAADVNEPAHSQSALRHAVAVHSRR